MPKTPDNTSNKGGSKDSAKKRGKDVIEEGRKEYTGKTESGREDKGAKR